MQRVALIGIHGISEHEPLAHSETLAKGAASFLKSRLGIECAVELGFERVSDTIALRDLPAPHFTLRRSDDAAMPFEIDIYDANWSKHTKRKATLFATVRRLYALCSTLNRGYRVFTRKFAIELLVLVCSLFIFAIGIFFPIYALALATNVIAAHVTAPHYPLVSLAIAICAVLGLSPTATWFWNIAIGKLALRTRKRVFQHLWENGKSEGIPYAARFLTSVSVSLSVPSNANEVFAIFSGFAAMCIFVVCTTLATLMIVYFHVKGLATVTPVEGRVVFFGILVGQFLPYLLRNVNNLLIPFEDVYAFSHSEARLQNESGSLEAFTCVAEKIRSVLRQRENDGKAKYDSVVVVGHSLGSFVALQAIELVERAGNHGAIVREDLDRLTSFVSYGSAVDKVWSYLRSSCPSKNLLADLPWFRASNIFCPASRPREGAIRWANLWYSTDLVGDRISVITDCCTNLHPRSPLTPWSHSHYLSDAAFWQVVLFEAFSGKLGLLSPYGDPEVAESVKVSELLTAPIQIPWMRFASFIGSLFAGFLSCCWLIGHHRPLLGLVAFLFTMLLPMLVFRDRVDRINLSRLPRRGSQRWEKLFYECIKRLGAIKVRLSGKMRT